jgi:hypothetical protein
MASKPAHKLDDLRAHERNDTPEVAALRKKIRGEPMSHAEVATLEATYRKPPPGTRTVPHDVVMRELAERRRHGE